MFNICVQLQAQISSQINLIKGQRPAKGRRTARLSGAHEPSSARNMHTAISTCASVALIRAVWLQTCVIQLDSAAMRSWTVCSCRANRWRQIMSQRTSTQRNATHTHTHTHTHTYGRRSLWQDLTFDPLNFDFGGKGNLVMWSDCLDSSLRSDTNSELCRNTQPAH